jgi:uncharacterized protein (TIGR03437 family)
LSGAESGVDTKLTVFAEAPGILTANGSQGVVLNQDLSPNSATNPAAEGSVNREHKQR